MKLNDFVNDYGAACPAELEDLQWEGELKYEVKEIDAEYHEDWYQAVFKVTLDGGFVIIYEYYDGRELVLSTKDENEAIETWENEFDSLVEEIERIQEQKEYEYKNEEDE